MKRILHLHLKGKWFDLIAAGTKIEEFREDTEYWRKRLVGREYDEIWIKKGYPKRGDMSRTLIRKWNRYRMTTITHPEFGDRPVEVFAIDVTMEID